MVNLHDFSTVVQALGYKQLLASHYQIKPDFLITLDKKHLLIL